MGQREVLEHLKTNAGKKLISTTISHDTGLRVSGVTMALRRLRKYPPKGFNFEAVKREDGRGRDTFLYWFMR